jgi:hypothetical protein
MPELRISEHTKLTGGDDFNAMADRAASVVWLWDCGPPEPKP